MGDAFASTWLMLAKFISGNGGYAVFVSLPIIFGALGYSFRVTAFVAAIFYIFISTYGKEVHDRSEFMAWVVGILVVHLLAFWVFHKAAQFLFRPTFPIHRWIIDRWTSRT